MPELPLPRGGLKAIVFDLDGTLYRQDALRRGMLVRLLAAHATRPLSGFRTVRSLAAYRQAQEHLRNAQTLSALATDVTEAQVQLACARTRMQPAFVRACVVRWMEEEPLSLLARHVQPGLLDFLSECKRQSLGLGVVSDYPAQAKLSALGLDGFMDVVLTAQSPEVGVFKPHPRGLLLAAERLGCRPHECLYVGDRAQVDGAAAVAAGMPCCIITSRSDAHVQQRDCLRAKGYPQLQELVFGSADRSV